MKFRARVLMRWFNSWENVSVARVSSPGFLFSTYPPEAVEQPVFFPFLNVWVFKVISLLLILT